MKILRVITGFVMLLLIFAITSCKGKESKVKSMDHVIVTLDWTPNTNHTGLYVALEKGYFKDEGIDVQIMQPGQGVTDQIVAAGTSQFGISYQENVIRSRSENIPLVSIAAIVQHNTSGFASLKKDNIISPKDFENKRYGSWDSPSEQAILGSIMKKNGADVSKVKIVSGVYDFFSTIGKDADFEWIYSGWDGIEAKRRGLEINYIALKDLDPVFDYYTPVLITNEKMLADNPDLVKRFVRATAKGYSFCIAQPDQSAEILIKHAPELNPELVKLSQQYLSKEYQADASKWGFQKAEVWKNFTEWMFINRLIPLSIETDKAFTNQYLP